MKYVVMMLICFNGIAQEFTSHQAMRARDTYKREIQKLKDKYIKALKQAKRTVTRSGDVAEIARIDAILKALAPKIPTGNFKVEFDTTGVRVYSFLKHGVKVEGRLIKAQFIGNDFILHISNTQVERWTYQNDGTYGVEFWKSAQHFHRGETAYMKGLATR